MPDYFLGVDSSTQSLTAVLIDFGKGKIVYRGSIIFDTDLPHYHTQNGVYISEHGKVVHSNPLMWVEAIDLLFEKLAQDQIPLDKIKAISGSGQQHGTVYLNKTFENILNKLDPDLTLVQQLSGIFSRKTSPIWMDSSTTKQCKEIRGILGGMKTVIELTGSNTFERFSGPQIRKFYQHSKSEYMDTQTIHLVSSFMASLLLGKSSPIDHGDGAGMNLMNISTKRWADKALEATAPGLKQKLPPLTNSYDIVGKISSYFVERYGFSQDICIIAWSGDNPNSLIGVGITEKGKNAISLGTSDTYFGYMKTLSFDTKGEGHVFSSPTGDYMSLICYKNGSLAREQIKNSFNLTWDEFSTILRNSLPGNKGKIMLPFFFPEIVPLVLQPKVYRFGFDETDMEGNIRGIIEAQFLSMRLHSTWIREKTDEIYATGGASANKEILQVAADIFSTKICNFEVSDSAALGAALRSAYSYYKFINKYKNWTDIVSKFLPLQKSGLILPNKDNKYLYDDMLTLYGLYETHVLTNAEDPEAVRQQFINKYFPNLT